ncbi:hypothetical protein FOZ63_026299 [Perkinsus olseni]|uniref:Uncharacterized protein n=1 Tax=Perkinsus olseni TaxID=32597 RepID=A0A7J6SEW6_PEROL|nr:hypothetical protein FOZ62_009301 [Perkinsus olseni]KAF4731347.1 hypothetical protein FOZ63_026299 [Perkinsus olseni]
MLFPAHVEALRLEMVERVWKESTVVGPLPELMCDIMAYIPKPALTLDCPMEEIIIKGKPDFFFTNNGILYGVVKQDKLISLEQLSSTAQPIPLVRFTGSSLWYYNAVYHYDAEASHLYILHDDGGTSQAVSKFRGTASLIDYDVKARKIHKIYKLPNLSDAIEFPQSMAVVGASILLGMEWGRTLGGTPRSIEVLYVNLTGKVNVVWHIHDRDVRLVGLHPVSASPLMLDVIYSAGNTCRSVRLEVEMLAARPVAKERCRRRMSMSQNAGHFGGGVLMVRNPPSISIFDSRLRPISSGLRLPGDPTCLRIHTDRHGGIYFSIERLVEGWRRYGVLSAFPYLN